jgi:catechol 2,3-dioxygenase-like lactoylglutathione lyase family enzyme
MLVGIDHLVVAVPDLDEAASVLEARLGIESGGGGVHPSLGTANRLAWFGDTYLELLAITDPVAAVASWLGAPAIQLLADQGTGGFVTFALASDDIEADLAAAAAIGSAIGGPMPGERRRSDGEVVRWRLAMPPTVGPDKSPFLIQHDLDGAEWRPADRQARDAAVHPLGGPVRLASLTIDVADPPSVVASYRSTLGLPPMSFGGGGIRSGVRSVTVGSQRIVLRRAVGVAGPPVQIDLTTAGGRGGSADLFGCRFVIRPT